MKLIRRSIHLPERQWQALQKAASELGISLPELVRRIFDEWQFRSVLTEMPSAPEQREKDK